EIIGKLYGYTIEEYYATKDRNREQVVEKIQELKDEPEITFETIELLHATNNREIVAKSASCLRKDPEDISTFTVRVGILSEDVQTEVDDVVARANNLMAKIKPNQRLSTLKRVWYELCAAKLHNDLLDIHPFLDRNGSTSLLFLELMMSKAGYEPSPKREPNYYNHIRKALNNNIAAIALIASEMFRIKFVPGHYRGITTQSPEKQKQYKENLQRKRKMNVEEKNN
ncbi:Fic family protein, partial [Patescibacteria group bacterium]|nr:Fic family protein [Patescibacteria group bacterium]